MNVPTTGAHIRDLGRVLPWMAAPPPDQSEDYVAILTSEALAGMSAGERTAVIEDLVRSCERRRAGVVAALDKMTAELEQARSMAVDDVMDAFADPDGEATDACEKAEAYFRAEREKLQGLRDNLLSSGGLLVYDPRIFVAIDDLYNRFRVGRVLHAGGALADPHG